MRVRFCLRPSTQMVTAIIAYSLLQPLLVGQVSAAAACASKEQLQPGVIVPGYGFEEKPMPVYVSRVLQSDLLQKAERIVSFLACVSKRA